MNPPLKKIAKYMANHIHQGYIEEHTTSNGKYPEPYFTFLANINANN